MPITSTRSLSSLVTSVSSGKTTRRDVNGRYPLYGSTGRIGSTSRVEFSGPSILVARVGVNAGSVYRVDGHYGVTDNTLVVRPGADQSVEFITEVLQRANLNRLIYGSGQPLVTGMILKNLEVPDLSPDMQRQIAATLGEANDLIASLERMIAKKKAIKQGILQQLLTGTIRLPGFTEPWSAVRLRDAGGSYGGLVGKNKDDFGHGSASFVTFVEVMEGARLEGRRLGRVRVRPAEHQNRVERGDVLFNGSSETPDEVALSAVVDFEPSATTYLNSFCFGYRLKRSDLLDPTYLACVFRSRTGRALVSSLAQGATRYNIARTRLLELSPVVPPLQEQRAVVGLLRDVDCEIASLESRLAKARDVKRGMMQELLTGRTRLPVEEGVP